MQVRAEVMRKTGNKQVPWEASSLVGSFYFSGGASSIGSNSGTNNALPSEIKFDAAAFEYNYWDSIKNSTSAGDYKAYLTKYPEGQFSSLARNRIKNLELVAKPVEPEPILRNSDGGEIAFWDSVKNTTNADDFRAYLKRFPNGMVADLAKIRWKILDKDEEGRRTVEAARKSSLEGTTWRGVSSGGDKHYEFQFLPNGELAYHLKWRSI